LGLAFKCWWKRNGEVGAWRQPLKEREGGIKGPGDTNPIWKKRKSVLQVWEKPTGGSQRLYRETSQRNIKIRSYLYDLSTELPKVTMASFATLAG